MKPLKDLIAQAERFTPRSRYEAPLSPVEEKIVALVADGRPDKLIAKDHGTTVNTVRSQVFHAKKKMGARTRAHLVSLWLKAKI